MCFWTRRAPEQDFEHAWKVTGESIRHRLRLGFDVLLHCWGGLGRAGTITARLLVELGVQPDDAIRRVRDAYEGTIENDSQLAVPSIYSSGRPELD